MTTKYIDPTPDNFKSYEDAAEFWDTHDTTDYLDEFKTVDVQSELRARHIEVEIDGNVIKPRALAKVKDVKLNDFYVSSWEWRLKKGSCKSYTE